MENNAARLTETIAREYPELLAHYNQRELAELVRVFCKRLLLAGKVRHLEETE